MLQELSHSIIGFEQAINYTRNHNKSGERFWFSLLLAEYLQSVNFEKSAISDLVDDALKINIMSDEKYKLGEAGILLYVKTIAHISQCVDVGNTLRLIRKILGRAHYITLRNLVLFMDEKGNNGPYFLKRAARQVIQGSTISKGLKEEFLIDLIIMLLAFDYGEARSMLLRFLHFSNNQGLWRNCRNIVTLGKPSNVIISELSVLVDKRFDIKRIHTIKQSLYNEIFHLEFMDPEGIIKSHFFIFGKLILSKSVQNTSELIKNRIDLQKIPTIRPLSLTLSKEQYVRLIRYEYQREDEKEIRWKLRKKGEVGKLTSADIITIRGLKVSDIAEDCSMILLTYVNEHKPHEYGEVFEQICKIAEGYSWKDWYQIHDEIPSYVEKAGLLRSLKLANKISDNRIREMLYTAVAKFLVRNDDINEWQYFYQCSINENIELLSIINIFAEWVQKRYKLDLTDIYNSSITFDLPKIGWID
jgi:hypothetical protein